jgi:hypothetical protein
MQRATTHVCLWVSATWAGCQYWSDVGGHASSLHFFLPVLALQILRIQVKHGQTRRRQLVKVLHGAGAGGCARRVSERKQLAGRSVLREARCA